MPILINEKELEEYILSLPIENHPLEVWGKCFQQFYVSAYGTIDLLYVDIGPCQSPHGYYPNITVHIVELKKGSIDYNAIGQIARYRTALTRILNYNQRSENKKLRYSFDVYGVLVGKDVGNGDVCFLLDQLNWISCFTYDISLTDGIKFHNSEGWYNSDEKLDIKYSDFKNSYFQALKYSIKEYKEYNKIDDSLKKHLEKKLFEEVF